MSTLFYKKVRRHLSTNCAVMKHIIGRVGSCQLSPDSGDPFTLLVRCIISQQISTKAARSIFGKLADVVGGPPVELTRVAKLTEANFKECGISGPKQRTLRAMIDHVKANSDFLPSIPKLDDTAIREQLTSIKGIGPWTADMFLLFGLGRPDVWPVGDYGIRVAVKTQFKLRKMPDAVKLTKLAKPWEPYRSVASWYLWRSLEFAKREKDA